MIFLGGKGAKEGGKFLSTIRKNDYAYLYTNIHIQYFFMTLARINRSKNLRNMHSQILLPTKRLTVRIMRICLLLNNSTKTSKIRFRFNLQSHNIRTIQNRFEKQLMYFFNNQNNYLLLSMKFENKF